MRSCKMSSIEEAGALDEDGESSETKGLLVIDRSVLSSECSGSWSYAYYLFNYAYCISKKLAESLKKEYFWIDNLH